MKIVHFNLDSQHVQPLLGLSNARNAQKQNDLQQQTF